VRRLVQFISIVLFLVGSQSWGTTIVFRRDHNRILVAADKRIQHVLPSGEQVVTDDKDKLLVLGRVVFAARGVAGYDGDGISSGWDNFHDAQNAFALYGSDTTQVADRWASKAIAHYSEWYAMRPDIVTKIAVDASGVLVTGVFFAWKNGIPEAVIRYIKFDSKAADHVFSTSEVKILDETESSLNGVTQNLIEHSYELMKKRWDAEKRTIKGKQLAWRHLRFLVEETSRIDNGVSHESDVLEIPLKGKPKWIMPVKRPLGHRTDLN
jgi:hypothetical protein